MERAFGTRLPDLRLPELRPSLGFSWAPFDRQKSQQPTRATRGMFSNTAESVHLEPRLLEADDSQVSFWNTAHQPLHPNLSNDTHGQRSNDILGNDRSLSVATRSRACERDSPMKTRDHRRLSRVRRREGSEASRVGQCHREAKESGRSSSPPRSISTVIATGEWPSSPTPSYSSNATVQTGRQWRSSSCTRMSSTIPTLQAALSFFPNTSQIDRATSSTALRQSRTRMPLMPYETLPTPPGRFVPEAPTTWFPHPSACLPPGAASQDFQAVYASPPY